MCYAVLADATVLRHVSYGLMAIGNKLQHIDMKYVVPKSTLSDSKKKKQLVVWLNKPRFIPTLLLIYIGRSSRRCTFKESIRY